MALFWRSQIAMFGRHRTVAARNGQRCPLQNLTMNIRTNENTIFVPSSHGTVISYEWNTYSLCFSSGTSTLRIQLGLGRLLCCEGKERKGKERKGKERKGKGRNSVSNVLLHSLFS